MTSRCCLILFAVILLFQGAVCLAAEEQQFSEGEVKAGFVYNFLKFIEWPDEAYANARKTLTVGVLGSDPFGPALGQIDGKVLRGMRIEIKRVSLSKDLRNCNVLFIGTSEKANLPQIMEIIKGASVLTIGDTEGYGKQGVIVNFFMEQNKVRFEINSDKARQARLTVSSKLLRLARIVTGG